MKQIGACFSVIILFFLIPVIIATVLLSAVSQTLLNENTYRDMLNKPENVQLITSTSAQVLKEIISNKKESFRPLLSTPKGTDALEKLVLTVNVPQSITNNVVNIIKYLKSETEDLTISLAGDIKESDVQAFKLSLVELYADYFTSQPKCATDQVYQNEIAQKDIPDCRPPSLKINDIIEFVRSIINENINYQSIKDTLGGSLPISNDFKDQLASARTGVKLSQNAIIAGWAIVAGLSLLIVFLNILGRPTFQGFLSTAAFLSAVFVAITGIIMQFLVKDHIAFSANQLGLSSQFDLESANVYASALNKLGQDLMTIFYTQLYIFAGILLAVSIFFFILKFVWRKSDKIKMEKDYYIPAYTSAPVTASPAGDVPLGPESIENRPKVAYPHSSLRSDTPVSPTETEHTNKPKRI